MNSLADLIMKVWPSVSHVTSANTAHTKALINYLVNQQCELEWYNPETRMMAAKTLIGMVLSQRVIP